MIGSPPNRRRLAALLGRGAVALAAGGLAAGVTPAWAQKKYSPGANDTTIKVGNIMAYSGPASAYGTIGKVEAAYFRMINEQGGINGRKIDFITYDDGYSPPKAVEMTRKLVEQDEVLLVFQPLGTPSNTAIRKYLNAKKVPQLFVATGASVWNDPKNHPWTMGWQPNYHTEGRIYAQHILQTRPDAKIAVLFQNDDSGRDYVKGFKDGLGGKVKQIVAEQSYEVTDPTIDSQIVEFKSSGADVFFNMTTPKFAAMAIRKAYDIGWKPVQYLVNVAASVGTVLVPAGVEKAVGIISTQYLKDPTDKAWADDPGMRKWQAFMKQYYPDGDLKDASNLYGYAVAQTLAQVLKQCGDDLTNANVMRQAANLKDFELDVLLPGIRINTGPDDFAPIEAEQLIRFDGAQWVRFGEVMGR
ncbi:MAG: ABC transporter substrate-binding protein [Burkholderiaceae bacterium]